MRPKLKISNLTQLQDARSSAAVGFDLISFNLERGSHKKLSASTIWNIVNWLSGPGIVLEMNVASLEELKEVDNMFPYRYISVPYEEWNSLLLNHAPAIIVRGDASSDPVVMQEMLDAAEAEEKEVKFELQLDEPTALIPYADVLAYCLIHFPTVDMIQKYITTTDSLPFGISLGSEAEEEPGFLDYERIDELVEVFFDRFPTSEPSPDPISNGE